MKLIYCRKCRDVIALRADGEGRECLCGKSWGRYVDGINAEIEGPCIPLGFANWSFTKALANQPSKSPGEIFTAFVIEKRCSHITAKTKSRRRDKV